LCCQLSSPLPPHRSCLLGAPDQDLGDILHPSISPKSWESGVFHSRYIATQKMVKSWESGAFHTIVSRSKKWPSLREPDLGRGKKKNHQVLRVGDLFHGQNRLGDFQGLRCSGWITGLGEMCLAFIWPSNRVIGCLCRFTWALYGHYMAL
jgi:hypothetical protein